MNPHSLLASAAINIGLAFITLSLFSILKKQPSLASIYYAHRLSHHHYIHFDSSYHRFLPSISWISRAYHVTEDDILHSHGLDALVIIRLFKFGLVNFHSHSSKS
ncbi:putative calcium permeable stress-gated cation channel 1 transmembrane domain-containing protein [Medicago truncatula]|uniref:Putative calcium permeable stress-gated cation channel 1 transmembrane domain-containing protein n=1 Tax=Medicago truncatula TaxID=3880 RepID=A0A396IMG2_MEDTR|nr:putative calcium permeable stress-gated cation channel 1 transmembrane domain-containing protein [Medicago truncatula]